MINDNEKSQYFNSNEERLIIQAKGSNTFEGAR
jgi:hypothetical protein